MVRLGELINRPVVSRDVGTKLGQVADLLVDGDRIIGIVLAGAFLRRKRCCRSVMSTSLGEDTVIAATAAAVVDARQWRKTV